MGPSIISFLQISSRHNQPKHIAWAIVWGCICGMLPKSSLLFYIASAASLLMPMHLVVTAIALVATSFSGPFVQPLMGNLGHWILSTSGLVGTIQSLDKFPLVPWLSLHNTVLIGAAATTITVALPAYWLLFKLVSKLHTKWMPAYEDSQRLVETTNSENERSPEGKSSKLISSDRRRDEPHSALASQLKATSLRPLTVSPALEPKPLAAALDRFDESMSSFTELQGRGSSQQVASSLSEVIDSIHALENLLEKVHSEADQPIDAQAVLARATQASELVDDILASLNDVAENPRPTIVASEHKSTRLDGQSPNHLRLDSPQLFQSHDTRISIYRRARTGELTVTGSDSKTLSEKDSMPIATDAEEHRSSLTFTESGSKSVLTRATVSGQTNEPSATGKHDSQQHEEALRHLLHHLRALKEKV